MQAAATRSMLAFLDVDCQHMEQKQQATDASPHAGAACDKYRFVVTLTHTGEGWRMSDLAGVS